MRSGKDERAGGVRERQKNDGPETPGIRRIGGRAIDLLALSCVRGKDERAGEDGRGAGEEKRKIFYLVKKNAPGREEDQRRAGRKEEEGGR